ncbi:hypothetical protein AHAS_Ahas11G0187200 [Arachis hypogaea]
MTTGSKTRIAKSWKKISYDWRLIYDDEDRADWEESPLGGEDPFVEEIMRARVHRNFKMPDKDLYNRTTDPRHHLSNFKSRMYLADA